MPHIAGVYDASVDETVIQSLLTRMARAIDIPGIASVKQQVLTRHTGCVNLLPGEVPPPSVSRAAGVQLMFDGELYNAAELEQWLRGQGQPCSGRSDAELCLALYRAEGSSCFARLNGQFNVVVHGEADDSLTIANDRYGYRPLFIAQEGTRFLFALEMKAIIAALDAPPRLDGTGIMQFMREGVALGDRTWLAPVRVLGPGTILEVSSQGVRRRRYFKLRYRDGRPSMSLLAFLDGFQAKLRRATERVVTTPGRVGIALSGGLDSRSVALAIPAASLPIPAYTFGYAQSRDVIYARRLAELLGLLHLHLELMPGYLGRVLPQVVWRTEGLLPFSSTTSICFHEKIGARMDVILTGHCGDALTGSHVRPYMMLRPSRAKLIERMFRGRQLATDSDLRLAFDPTFYRRHSADLMDAMAATFSDIDNEDPVNVADAWDMENRQHRGTFHSPSVDRYRFGARTPFLDNDLVDHLLTAPPRWRFQQTAYKKMILQAFPHAAEVPWAYTGNPLTPSPAVELARIALNYGAKRLRTLSSRWRANGTGFAPEDFRDLASELGADRRVAQSILDFVESTYFPGDIFNPNGIREIVRRHWEGGEDLHHLVTCLATIAEAHRLFLLHRPDVVPAEAQPTGARASADTGQGTPPGAILGSEG